MSDIDVFQRMSEIAATPQFAMVFGDDNELTRKVVEHREWLKSIRHERPSPEVPFKVGIYIRYFNQTRYENYLEFHKKQFEDTIALCPNWTLVDFYIDEGSTAPNMETAPAWSQLLDDCFDEKVNLIITQKVSNVSKRTAEVTLCARLLAAQKNPIGIYFISEDIFTLASYYRDDLKDPFFLPTPDWKPLPDTEEEIRGYLHD